MDNFLLDVRDINHKHIVVVLENGSVVEEGSHEKLMENTKGLYFKMYNTQAKHYS